MTLSEIARKSHQIARDKGWWEPGKEKSLEECCMLVISELSEAVEEFRKGTPPAYTIQSSHDNSEIVPLQFDNPPASKPEGWLVELADVIIRLGDWMGKKNAEEDFERLVMNTSFDIDNEDSPLENSWRFTKILSSASSEEWLFALSKATSFVYSWVESLNLCVELDQTIAIKMAYNEGRPYRHGNKKY